MTVTTTQSLRLLGGGDRAALLELCDRDPIAHCFVRSRVEAAGLDPWRLGAEVWGWFDGPDLVSALHHGANVVPVETCAAATVAFAARARRIGRRCSSIVGPAYDVLALWAELPGWSSRSVRADQPLLAMSVPSAVPPDPAVTRVPIERLDALVPACVAMFTEEVGVSPIVGGASGAYRSRVSELVANGRAFARFEGDHVIFKAELGALSSRCSQIQGVWVPTARRGTGLAAPGVAAVVAAALTLAPITSLYVNGYNGVARSVYERVGFAQVGTFATVLF